MVIPRQLKILTATLLGLTVVASSSFVVFGRVPIEKAKRGYELREVFDKPAKRRHPRRPLVAWLGDSTILHLSKVAAYPAILELRSTSTPRPIESFIEARQGLDPYVYYMILERALELKPSAVFIIASLHLMRPVGANRPLLQLAPMIPLAELPHAIFLPWHARSLDWPRLLIARALAADAVEQTVYFFEGLRVMFRDAVYRTKPKISVAETPFMQTNLRLYDTPISRRSPSVGMLAAAVQRATKRGIPTTVIVPPAPIQMLKSIGLYNPEMPARVDIIRRAVEAAGGEVLDLHAVLGDAGFRDRGGHYTGIGAEYLAGVLAPVVHRNVERGLEQAAAD